MATTTQDISMDATNAALLSKVQPAELNEQPLVTNNRDFNWVTDKICRIVETRTPTWWWICMAVALMTASFTGLGLLQNGDTLFTLGRSQAVSGIVAERSLGGAAGGVGLVLIARRAGFLQAGKTFGQLLIRHGGHLAGGAPLEGALGPLLDHDGLRPPVAERLLHLTGVHRLAKLKLAWFGQAERLLALGAVVVVIGRHCVSKTLLTAAGAASSFRDCQRIAFIPVLVIPAAGMLLL